MNPGRVAAVVPAAGLGTRFGSAENKIWAPIAGRPVIAWALHALCNDPSVGHVVLVGNPRDLDRLRREFSRLPKMDAIVEGGDTRAASVRNGLAALPAGCEIVLVHDAARPAASPALIRRVLETTAERGAAVPGIPVSDTLKRTRHDGVIMETVSRSGLWAVQTPQGARLAWLTRAFAMLGAAADEYTDEAGVLEAAGYAVHIVQGDADNIKITEPADIERAARVLAGERGKEAAMHRIGFGYDVHPFAPERKLWLGGAAIPYELGLAGHSDADVVLHAVCDAILGAAGLGDIGLLFPDTDEANRNRPSSEFILEAKTRLDALGWQVQNVDVTLLAEAPRIAAYRPQMAEHIAALLGIASERVNIKATTSEGMGFIGRKEGIACYAVALIAHTRPATTSLGPPPAASSP
ncbi:MAG: 2-C-methyl-D-erythritol 4-phosphate cytidylyltransferase [Chthonomonadales bacterium]